MTLGDTAKRETVYWDLGRECFTVSNSRNRDVCDDSECEWRACRGQADYEVSSADKRDFFQFNQRFGEETQASSKAAGQFVFTSIINGHSRILETNLRIPNNC